MKQVNVLDKDIGWYGRLSTVIVKRLQVPEWYIIPLTLARGDVEVVLHFPPPEIKQCKGLLQAAKLHQEISSIVPL